MNLMFGVERKPSSSKGSNIASNKASQKQANGSKSSRNQKQRQKQAKQLAPIYNKVQILRRELQDKCVQQNTLYNQQVLAPKVQQHFIQLLFDRNRDIEDIRKQHAILQQHQSHQIGENQPNLTQQKLSKTATNWKNQGRNKTQSLIKFLKHSKSVPNRMKIKEDIAQDSPRVTVINKETENDDFFEPVGEQYFKEKLYQESMRSQTISVSSRPESSLKLSKIGTANSKDSKKYLRKGTRVREILMRQLQSSQQQRTSSRGSMTYLKDYDQWVPSSLASEKRAELQSFMSIIYGGKKAKEGPDVDLNKIQLYYL